MLGVNFRSATESDKAVFPWKRYGVNQLRPHVVTVNGHVVLMLAGDEVLYQRSDIVGSEVIADLIRAGKAVTRALTRLDFDGREALTRRGKNSILSPHYEDPWEHYRSVFHQATEEAS